MKRLLGDRDLRRLFIGQSVSMLGDSMMLLVLGVWVKELTGSNAAAGAMILLVVLPGLGAPLAGYLVDRVRRRRFLVIANLASALVVLPLLAVNGRDSIWIIGVVACLYGVSYALLAPGMSALLQAIVPADDLVPANALIQTVRQGLRLVGPLIGAMLYAAFGATTVVLVDMGTFVVAALCLWSMRSADPVPDAMPSNFRVEITAGLQHIRNTPVLRRTIITTAIAVLVIGFDEAVVFAVVDDGLDRPPTFLGVLECCQGAGALIGGFSAVRLIRQRTEPAVLGIGLIAMAIACASMTTGVLIPVLGGVALFGIGLTWVVVAFRTLVQSRTPTVLVGRTSAAADLAVSAPQVLSIGLGALLVSRVDYRLLLITMTVVLMACAGGLMRSTSRQTALRHRAPVTAHSGR